ncbi:MAG TPA: hypothetical protein VJ558_07960 [Bacillales bacterium]|nr:hypothetical protein [Bacillales bacterium]
MKKKFLLIIICSMTMLAACTNTKDVVNQLKKDKEKLILNVNENEKNQKILKQQIAELEKEIKIKQEEKELYTIISNLSREFVEAHTSGNKEKLRSLMLDNLFFEEENNKLYVNNNANEKWLLFPMGNLHLDDWVIQGFQYQPESNTFTVHIREFYKNAKGVLDSPPTFLNLDFKLDNNEWKIISLSFDV